MFEDMFKKKSLKKSLERNKNKKCLKRTLGPVELILLGIGAIIGAGIFVIAGIASINAGPAIIVSFALAALICVFAALCYAEVSASIPLAGSLYTYAYISMGKFWAWIIAWIIMTQYMILASVVAIGWSSYIVGFITSFGIQLSPTLIGPGPNGGIINLPAIFIVILLTTILARGMKESNTINAIMVFIKVIVILLFIIVGLNFIKPVNYHPFTPFGLSGIATGITIVFFAYNGFDAVAQAAEETKNPGITLPIGIIGSLGICAVLYIVVAAVMIGMVPFNLLDTASPIAFALQYVGAQWAFTVLSVGVIAGLTSVTLIYLYSNSRTIFALSRDGMLPLIFSKISTRNNIPFISTIFVGAISAIVAGVFSLGSIYEIVNLVMLLSFIVIALSVILLRKQQPELKRPFKCPLVPAIPVLVIVCSLVLITQLNFYVVSTFFVWIVIGGFVYFAYKRYGNKIQEKNLEENNTLGKDFKN